MTVKTSCNVQSCCCQESLFWIEDLTQQLIEPRTVLRMTLAGMLHGRFPLKSETIEILQRCTARTRLEHESNFRIMEACLVLPLELGSDVSPPIVTVGTIFDRSHFRPAFGCSTSHVWISIMLDRSHVKGSLLVASNC